MCSTKNDTLEVKFGSGFGARAAAACYLTGTNQPRATEATFDWFRGDSAGHSIFAVLVF